MLYPVKVLHIRHNLFIGSETLSVYEPIAIHILLGKGSFPQFGGNGGVWGSIVVPVKPTTMKGHHLSIKTDTLSRIV